MNPATLSKEELRALGVTERLPASLTEALEALKSDSDLFGEGMSKMLVDVFGIVKRAEVVYMNGLTPREQLKVIIDNY